MPRRLSHLSDLVRVGEHGSKAISEIRRLTMRHESSRPGRLHTIGHAPTALAIIGRPICIPFVRRNAEACRPCKTLGICKLHRPA